MNEARPITCDVSLLSDLERTIIERYIRTRPIVVSGSDDEHATLRLIVGPQEFTVGEMPLRMIEPYTVDETEWSGVQLAKALAAMVNDIERKDA